MMTVLIVLCTAVWIVAASALYGVIVGKSIAEVSEEAVGFGCASGLAACVLAAFLARLAA